jgi:hypothetical protein
VGIEGSKHRARAEGGSAVDTHRCLSWPAHTRTAFLSCSCRKTCLQAYFIQTSALFRLCLPAPFNSNSQRPPVLSHSCLPWSPVTALCTSMLWSTGQGPAAAAAAAAAVLVMLCPSCQCTATSCRLTLWVTLGGPPSPSAPHWMTHSHQQANR